MQKMDDLALGCEMASGNDKMNAPAGLDELDQAERLVGQHADYFRTLKARLALARKNFSTQPAVTLSQLISDIKGLPPQPEDLTISALVGSLEQHLHDIRRRLESNLARDLRDQCEDAKLAFKQLPDGFGVGPFFVAADFGKEQATFRYAKVDLLKNVPLNSRSIISKAIDLGSALLTESLNVREIEALVEEGMRVSLARQKKLPKNEMRVEFPALFREMSFIRHDVGQTKRTALAGYPIPRFVVEVQTLLQSEENLRGEKQFRPETAVLENTKNLRKSFFFPRDLACGYGEGTYYQALVLRVP